MALNASILTYDGLDQIDTVKRMALGTRIEIGHNAYVYVQGVSSGAAGSWVSFTGAGVTTLLAANAIGRVGILMAALDATTKYGFAQVRGVNTLAKTDTVAAGLPLYIDGTAGRADDLAVSGDLIAGAWSVTADSSNVATVILVHDAYVTDTLS